ncbi:hypothetical protein R1flu_009324 [Riccia fluitans]|uniref:Uncharacterized protein n=1 Tax=Riccia fluitans TaxID=41844 RepID=A0ABD1Z4S4_9MARC
MNQKTHTDKTVRTHAENINLNLSINYQVLVKRRARGFPRLLRDIRCTGYEVYKYGPMAAATKLGVRDFTSNLVQQSGSFSPARRSRSEWNRLPCIRLEHHERRLQVSCSFEHGLLTPSQRRTNKLQFFKQSALPLDKTSIEKDAKEVESETEEPWLGAVMFKRSAVQSHYELQTSLERLGLTVLSSEDSRTLAKSIGIITKTSESGAEQFTPVGISIDVSREGRDLRLDGLVRTAISLCCNRCLSPVVERVLADFSLLLTEKPVMEPSQQRIGVVLGDQSPNEDGDVLDIDLDDKLHFPRDCKEMDLSKYIRDTVHLEIPSKSLCSADCSGLCLSCGVNLNKDTCKCVDDVKVKPSWGPLEQLKRQLEEESREEGTDNTVDG